MAAIASRDTAVVERARACFGLGGDEVDEAQRHAIETITRLWPRKLRSDRNC